MITLSKKHGDKIIQYSFSDEDSFKNSDWCSCGYTYIRDIDFDKSYVKELYCRSICGNCYSFGCDWDIRCNENNKPINQIVRECDKFKKGEEIYKELIKKIESDKSFYEFCKIVNSIKNGKRESDLEVFLGVFNKNF